MSNRNIARYGLFFFLFCLAGWVGSVSAAPKNIIVFIGDGMGPEHVRAAGYYYNGASGVFPFEGFPFQGYLTTYSADNAVTDSAAAGTALATGHKANNGVISMAYPANADYPVQGSEMLTLLEYFKAISKSTGLVSTAYLTDATPAAFGAHESSRSNTAQIAADFYTQTHPNVLLGGGGNGQSTAAAQTAGYTVVTTKTGLLGLNPETTGPVSGQFGSSDFPYFYDGYGTTYPRLAEMTDVALRILDNDPEGFFLMVDGGRIDDAAHANDLARAIPDVGELSAAVQVAIDWAAGRNDTLIVVTADHETGGLNVVTNNGIGVYPTVTWSTTGHTATNVPAYGLGVNAGFIGGVLDNTNLFGIATADTITLMTPAEGAVVRDPTAIFSCSVISDRTLVDATLYLGQGTWTTKTVAFSGMAATEDGQLNADAPAVNYGSATSITVDGETPHAHGVVRFPGLIGNGTDQVPVGSAITSATLKVYCTNNSVNLLKLYRLTDSWVEDEATWNQRAAGIAWTGEGGAATAYEGAGIDGSCSATGWRTINVTQIVQDWSDGEENCGFVILDSGIDGVAFDSSEGANPPVLTVTCEPALRVIETKTLSGNSATAVFSPVVVANQMDYTWNCLVRSMNTTGQFWQAWAPLDGHFHTDWVDTTPPAISSVDDVSVTVTTATITWMTDEPATSVVRYGTTTELGSESGDVPLVSSHSIVLEGLTPGTLYYFEVESADGAGNTAVDNNIGTYYSFTTNPADTQPPTITSVDATAVLETTATILWITNEAAGSVVRYWVEGGQPTSLSDAALVPAHSIALTGLVQGTTYFFEVESSDASGNTAIDNNGGFFYTFTTSSDLVPPVISDLTVSGINDLSATISWTTDEDAASMVRYGTTTAMGSEATLIGLRKNHSIVLDGLTEGTSYFFEVQSIDASGNATISGQQTFTTLTWIPHELFADGFESGNLTAGGWTVSGSASVGSAGAFTGGFGAALKKAAWIQKAVSTQGMKNIHIQYARKTAGLDSGEYLIVEWSIDGSAWNILETSAATAWATQDLTCDSGAENQPGFRLRFRTNGNRVDEYGYVDAVAIVGSHLGQVNHEPVVIILQPGDGATFTFGIPITFMASAADDEDGNLTASIVWQSSIDGPIGTGGSFSTSTLSQGNHTITASVTDSGSVMGSASILITVGVVAEKIHSESITMSLAPSGKNTKATAAVLVHDQADLPVTGALITGNWYLNDVLIQSGATGTTEASGIASITSPAKNAKSGATFKFEITTITLTGYEYDPTQGVTWKTISVP